MSSTIKIKFHSIFSCILQEFFFFFSTTYSTFFWFCIKNRSKTNCLTSFSFLFLVHFLPSFCHQNDCLLCLSTKGKLADILKLFLTVFGISCPSSVQNSCGLNLVIERKQGNLFCGGKKMNQSNVLCIYIYVFYISVCVTLKVCPKQTLILSQTQCSHIPQEVILSPVCSNPDSVLSVLLTQESIDCHFILSSLILLLVQKVGVSLVSVFTLPQGTTDG